MQQLKEAERSKEDCDQEIPEEGIGHSQHIDVFVSMTHQRPQESLR